MNVRLILALLLASLSLQAAHAQTRTSISLDGYSTLLSVSLKSGDLNLLESPNGSTFAVWFDSSPAPSCSAEVLYEPTRIVFDCAGRILRDLKSISIKNSALAQKLRFGSGGSSSKIVIDMSQEVLATNSPTAGGGKQIFVFGKKAKLRAGADEPALDSDPSTAVVAPAPTKTPIALADSASESPGPVHTPVPLPKIAYGETELASFVFARNAELNGPTIKISLRAARQAELTKESPTSYLLTIQTARIYSPIFTQPQMAPEGFEPFVQATPSETQTTGGPFNIQVRIELSQPAELQVRQNAGDIEVFTGVK